VLAGMVGACMAGSAHGDGETFHAACSAVFAHGKVADLWALNKPGQALTASVLAAAQ
jgi:ADP-dependent NAD(P)H-hydrate dehydratase / NAD(P)H-hydrate epimerase